MSTAELFRMADEVVIVTGGAGLLGSMFVGALVDAGARVAVFDRAPVPNTDGRVLSLEVDVTNRGSIERAVTEVERRFGVPTGLVNAAALDSPPNAPAEENGPVEHYPEASWDRIIDVNVKGVFLCCQVVGGRMAQAGRGSIVNIGSIYGIVSPDQRLYEYRRKTGEAFFKPITYSVSKSALLNMTRYLATYWADRKVRVNTLTFGGVYNQQNEEFVKAYSARVPLGRMADAAEYVGPLVFLLSGASSYMTGANLVVDGGFTAW